MGIIGKAAVLLSWPTQQRVGLAGAFDVYYDAGDGSVDYGSAINPYPLPAWPDGEGKIGAGLGPAGEGAAGFGHGGAGAGEGAAGLGMAGFGAELYNWRTAELADDAYGFAVVGVDAAGNAVTPATEIAEITVAAVPNPPGVPAATAYDDGTDTLTLEWDLSSDDEG